MLNFIKNFLNKRKAAKLLAEITDFENKLCVFEIIEANEDADRKLVKSLSNEKKYESLLSKYKDIILKISEHNEDVKALNFMCNSIIEQFPVDYILENILNLDCNKLSEIRASFENVFKYKLPHDSDIGEIYKEYLTKIILIINNYNEIKYQKGLIDRIEECIEKIPDKYIDYDLSEDIFDEIRKINILFNACVQKYYKTPQISKNLIDKHNEEYIARHINDKLFDNVKNVSLDIEQRKAVLCDSKSNLVIAGAGSGKTLTICGKVKYLLEKGIASKDEILLLSYSNESAKDLDNKVKEISDGLTVKTFHSLGYQILTETYGKKKAIEEQLNAYIKEYFDEELQKKPKLAEEVLQYVAYYFYSAPKTSKKYKNEGELFEELKKKEFVTLKDCLGKLTDNRKRHETLKREYVRSQEELIIANYLFTNGIKYEYEKPYEIETCTLDRRQYTPDFYLSDYGIYLEHYGIDKDGNTPQYGPEESKEYIDSIKWKRDTHEKNGTVCLETYSYEFQEGTIFDHLKKKLEEKGVKYNPLSQAEIFNALYGVYSGKDFGSLLNLISTFLSLYKSQMQDECGFEKLKSKAVVNRYDGARTRLFLDICKGIYNYYIKSLREADKIDFDDMILQAINALDLTDGFKYKYIIVDEFQDISQSRTKFLQKLLKHGDAKLFAVGDDWQAIYRFAGCDINVFLDFEKIFKNAKLNYITSTHRNSSELQKIVEPFITANPSQYKKHIVSQKHQQDPVRIVYHNGDKSAALYDALKDIACIDAKTEVLILGRNKRDIDAYLDRDFRFVGKENILKHVHFPDMDIKYSTVHGAKGIEREYVVLISGDDAQNGFPNKTEDDALLTLLLGKKNDYRFAEERRLFYVALTRTKKVVYIISDANKPSEFVKEIESKCYILRDADEDDSDQIDCPWCISGKLRIRKNEETGKSFYGCSNYPYCTYTNDNMKSVRDNKRCPVCGDFMVKRKGQYGYFWGCHNYPRCRYKDKL